jgi:hypothetical protein
MKQAENSATAISASKIPAGIPIYQTTHLRIIKKSHQGFPKSLLLNQTSHITTTLKLFQTSTTTFQASAIQPKP